MPARSPDVVVVWGKSEARDVLYDMLLAGEIPSDMKPKAVYLAYLKHLPSFEPFQNYTALKFSGKLKSARERAGNKVNRALEDAEYFEHDRAIFPAPTVDTKGQPMWKGSKAQEKLRKALADIDSGKKAYVKPRILYMEEDEWNEDYPLEFFRKKLYQEMKFQKRAAWLLEKYGLPAEEEEEVGHAAA